MTISPQNPGSRAAAMALGALLLAPLLTVSSQELPDFGSPADSVLSKSREKLLGSTVIFQLRQAGAIVEDPQLNEYIRLLGSQLASQANDGDFNFEFFVIDDDVINAFAMPGGVIGVNAGLILATDNESELAGVIAHEVSHVTQRHIARGALQQQRASIMSMATTLAALLLATQSDSSAETATGVATAAQAAAVQSQINFTRAHEFEADRIGIGLLSQSGFNPTGMVSFFEKLSRRETAYAGAIPEMLRTHPTSAGRITEAKNRARQLPRGGRVDSVEYGLVKARIRVLSARTPEEAYAYYRELGDSDDPAIRYGRALSLMRLDRNDEAERLFRELSRENPSVIAYRIGRAEALMANGADEQALTVYRDANVLSPRNVPLVISYGEALLQSGRPDEAHKILLDLLNNTNPAPAEIGLLARAASAEGDQINAHHYQSEFYASIGALNQAIGQLRMALALPGLNDVQRVRFEARIREFEEVLAERDR